LKDSKTFSNFEATKGFYGILMDPGSKDYTRLSAISVNDSMPQPDIEDILSKLKDSKIFSNFDATKGFYGIPMDPGSKDYTSFITGRDSYRFNVLPFVLSNSPASYSRLMRKILENAENLDNFVDE